MFDAGGPGTGGVIWALVFVSRDVEPVPSQCLPIGGLNDHLFEIPTL